MTPQKRVRHVYYAIERCTFAHRGGGEGARSPSSVSKDVIEGCHQSTLAKRKLLRSTAGLCPPGHTLLGIPSVLASHTSTWQEDGGMLEILGKKR